jgi:alanine-glyoxylate transaminase/serine-glyoxylate transaminase/serine-pyruvate transaminase
MSAAVTTKPRGRLFFANPGPTNIPDSILHAIGHHAVDFNDPEFLKVYDECWEGVLRVMKTTQHMFMYTGSGHAAWEASLVNLLSPGETMLIIETGNFSESWGRMAADLGIKVQTLAADWRQGPWTLGASLVHLGSRPDGGIELAAETTLDLAATWRLAPGWQVAARLDNATDEARVPARDYQGLGRQAWLVLRWETGK